MNHSQHESLAVQLDGVVPKDLSLGFIRDGLSIELGQRFRWFYTIKMRVVGIPNDAVALKMIDGINQSGLITVASHCALAKKILARQHGYFLWLAHNAVTTVRVHVHPSKPKGQPAGIGFESPGAVWEIVLGSR